MRENEIVGGRFRLERLLGEGGMGVVWAAHDLSADRRVALKFLRVANLTEQIAKRFYREARAAMAVRHPNVVRIHEVFVGTDGRPVMSMDFLDGESLAERLEREGKLSLAAFGDVFLPVVSAIGAAHARGIIHRDLKPENIFLCRTMTGFDVRVLDFGIAKLTASEGEAAATAGLTATGAMMGTPYYMSPEQVFAHKDIDHRSDIWSLGVILYECLSGKKPVRGDSIGAILQVIMTAIPEPLRMVEPTLPPDLLALADAMLTVKKEGRPSSLAEVTAVIERYSLAKTLPFGDVGSAPLSLADTLPLVPTPLDFAFGATLDAVDLPARAAHSSTPSPPAASVTSRGLRSSRTALALGGALFVGLAGLGAAGGWALYGRGERAAVRPTASGGIGASPAPAVAPSESVSTVLPVALSASASASTSAPPPGSSSPPGIALRKRPTVPNAPSAHPAGAASALAPSPSVKPVPRGIASENPYGN